MTTQQRRPPPQDSEKSPKQEQQPRSPLSNWLNWALLIGLIIWNILLFWPGGQPPSITVPYTTFLAQVQAGNVKQVSIQGADIKGALAQALPAAVLLGTPTAGTTPQATPDATPTAFTNFQTTFPDTVGDPTLMPLLVSHNVVVNVSTPTTPWFLVLLDNAFPFLLLP